VKRKYKKLQDEMDKTIELAIENGATSKQEIFEIVRQYCEIMPLKDLVHQWCQMQVWQCKQRLRHKGLVEILDNEEVREIEDLTQVDIESIDNRRAKFIHGLLINRLKFCLKYGRIQESQAIRQQLQVQTTTAAPEPKPQMSLHE
jgi:hypothetical protein